jgi:hypothetical protein
VVAGIAEEGSNRPAAGVGSRPEEDHIDREGDRRTYVDNRIRMIANNARGTSVGSFPTYPLNTANESTEDMSQDSLEGRLDEVRRDSLCHYRSEARSQKDTNRIRRNRRKHLRLRGSSGRRTVSWLIITHGDEDLLNDK